MKSITIEKTEDGIKLHKYLKNIFKEMPSSLLQKLLRKKYFEINNNVANGNEILKTKDVINIYLGDETFEKFFCDKSSFRDNNKKIFKDSNIKFDKEKIVKNIVYEDDNLIIFNKWLGLLSENDKNSNFSVNTLLNWYLELSDKSGKNKSNYNYKPGVVNRLDRNTEGLIIFAKSYIFAREISKMISDNNIDKYYKTIVNGIVKQDEDTLTNLYRKDEKKNIAIIKDLDDDVKNSESLKGFTIVKLKYKVIKRNTDSTILDIKLITGKSHQIRAQLSYIGHPIICDKKYMDESLYDDNVSSYKSRYHKLCCYKIKFYDFENNDLKYLSDKTFKIDVDF